MLSEQECQELWEQASPAHPIVVDSPEGKEVMSWLHRQNHPNAPAKKIQINSFQEFVSPVDGSVINNRKLLAEHNRRNGVEQAGNEYSKHREERHYEHQEKVKEAAESASQDTTMEHLGHFNQLMEQ